MITSDSTGAGFAVIDFETTGLWPESGHRVVEIAVVHVDANGVIEGSWETIVNPQREIESTRLHGIRTIDIVQAPLFDDIAPRLVQLLSGRVLVAHNAPFELRFLASELARLGLDSPLLDRDILCTMRLAKRFLPGSGRSLTDCSAAYDIDLPSVHEALADALATARLLGCYLKQDGRLAEWGDHATRARAIEWPDLAPTDAAWTARSRRERVARAFLDRSTLSLPEIESSPQTDHRELQYLALLDQAISDGFLSARESETLRDIATELEIDSFSRDILHRRYFDSLVTAAWRDSELTDSERADIVSVARLLSIPTRLIAWAIQPRTAEHFERASTFRTPPRPDAPDLGPGDLVALTGEMTRPRTFYEQAISDLGMVAGDAITRQTSVLVAADVHSLSGKARKARAYGIPIVSEEQFMGVLVG